MSSSTLTAKLRQAALWAHKQLKWRQHVEYVLDPEELLFGKSGVVRKNSVA